MSLCFFSKKQAEIIILPRHDGEQITVDELWQYWISGRAKLAYHGSDALNEKEQLLCLQETIKLNKENLIPYWMASSENRDPIDNPRIVFRAIEEFKTKKIDHENKDLKILKLLASKASESLNPFLFTHLNLKDRYSIGVFDDDEFYHWLCHLYQERSITCEPILKGRFETTQPTTPQGVWEAIASDKNIFGITTHGWKVIQNLKTIESKNVFIAMAFTDAQKKPVSIELRDTIKTTLENISWKPLIVDEVEHNDGIMDKVIALIKESRFVVAELTHQKSGVYYEAGFAKGFGLPTIHIVKEDDFDNCHFDVKHLNLIIWQDFDDLAQKLQNRVKATITSSSQ